MRWSESIDMYCERTDPGLWSEPLNVATNLAFLLAAALLWRQAGRGAGRDTRVLILLIGAVGLGSMAFHTLATRWAALLDIGFIAVFVLFFHQRFQVRALGRSNGAANLGVAVFVVLAGLFVLAIKQLPTLSQNDSESYLAPFLLLLVCARQAAPRWPEAARWLNRAAGLFVASLVCRAIDQPLCAVWPAGTHLGWHLINAAMLYCCLRGLLATRPAAG
ncbi:ceramidase domain-containing protein [Zoogloea sp.]|jgi:hypothetical protein|uniref:ceramidase domain-containing protein n=1 Tax=Zoogloea sp. TaxID=49181 RepID=UPI0035B42CF5